MTQHYLERNENWEILEKDLANKSKLAEREFDLLGWKQLKKLLFALFIEIDIILNVIVIISWFGRDPKRHENNEGELRDNTNCFIQCPNEFGLAVVLCIFQCGFILGNVALVFYTDYQQESLVADRSAVNVRRGVVRFEHVRWDGELFLSLIMNIIGFGPMFAWIRSIWKKYVISTHVWDDDRSSALEFYRLTMWSTFILSYLY
eukprot:UN33942